MLVILVLVLLVCLVLLFRDFSVFLTVVGLSGVFFPWGGGRIMHLVVLYGYHWSLG